MVDDVPVEITAQWFGATLRVEGATPTCDTSVRREYQIAKDGKSLQLKILIQYPGRHPWKLDWTVFYSRDSVRAAP